MRIGMIMDHSGGFEETVETMSDYERAGLELVAVAEAYSFDAVSQLGYLAARTKRLELMSGILQIYSRTPSLLAMTAAGLDYVSGGRFTLGIGASGPQVVEGFHGVPYDAPLGRTREVIDICRQVWRREPLVHDGRYYQVPLPAGRGSGLGKPLKLINHPVRDRIPISVAALGEKNVSLVAEVADGWQPLFFHPHRVHEAWGAALEEGTSRRAADLGRLDIQLQVTLAIGDDVEPAREAVRQQLALYIGGMGARGKNFYNQLARRYGYESEAVEIQDLYLDGRKAEAAKVVPDDLVDAVSLVGGEAQIRAQLQALTAAGVTTLLVNPAAATLEAKINDVERLVRLVGEQQDHSEELPWV
jgi:F420-dependent oxidoreductase-like protein